MRRRKWVRVCAAGRGRFLWLTAAFRLLFQRSAHARSYRCSVPPKACSRRCGSPQAAAARSPCMRRASACACRPLALAHSSCCCTGPHSGPWPSVQKRGTPAHSLDGLARRRRRLRSEQHGTPCGATSARLRAAQRSVALSPCPLLAAGAIAVVFRCLETAFSAMVTLPQLWSVENGALVGSGRPTAVIPPHAMPLTALAARMPSHRMFRAACVRWWREARRAMADAVYRTALPRLQLSLAGAVGGHGRSTHGSLGCRIHSYVAQAASGAPKFLAAAWDPHHISQALPRHRCASDSRCTAGKQATVPHGITVPRGISQTRRRAFAFGVGRPPRSGAPAGCRLTEAPAGWQAQQCTALGWQVATTSEAADITVTARPCRPARCGPTHHLALPLALVHSPRLRLSCDRRGTMPHTPRAERCHAVISCDFVCAVVTRCRPDEVAPAAEL